MYRFAYKIKLFFNNVYETSQLTYTLAHQKKLDSTLEFSFFYESPAQNLIILVQASSNCSIDVA